MEFISRTMGVNDLIRRVNHLNHGLNRLNLILKHPYHGSISPELSGLSS